MTSRERMLCAIRGERPDVVTPGIATNRKSS